MTKRQAEDYKQRKRLENSNWNIQKRDAVHFNGGSETLAHANLKLIVAWYLKYEQGYRVDTEVEMPDGEVDVLAWNAEDIICVECETSPTDDVIADKIERYVNGQPPRECFVLNVNEAPANIHECYEWVSEQL